MTKEEIARIINPEYPWVYSPTTAPTKLVLQDGTIKVGYFQFTRSSPDLEKSGKFTFIEFGENAEYYKATGDEKYVTVIDSKNLLGVEYPSYSEHDMPLNSIVHKLDSLRKQLEERVLTVDKLILLISDYRLDWGISEPRKFSKEYTIGATKQILLDGLSNQTSSITEKSNLPSNNKIISLLSQFLIQNILTKEMLSELYMLLFNKEGTFRKHIATAHSRKSQDIVYVYPEKIESEIEKLLEWYKNQNYKPDKLSPLFLGAIFHYRFVCIHPFEDGNGRIARILTSMILLKNKIPPPRVRLEDRVFYIDSLRKADQDDLESWIKFLGKKIIFSIEGLLTK